MHKTVCQIIAFGVYLGQNNSTTSLSNVILKGLYVNEKYKCS